MKMKHVIVSVLFMASLVVSSANAKTAKVKGYTKKNGAYVAPYFKTTPDKSKYNNYSSKGNSNPYTGKKGTKNPNK